jgi:hypothetical protein
MQEISANVGHSMHADLLIVEESEETIDFEWLHYL